MRMARRSASLQHESAQSGPETRRNDPSVLASSHHHRPDLDTAGEEPSTLLQSTTHHLNNPPRMLSLTPRSDHGHGHGSIMKRDLSGGAIAGATVGCVIGAALILLCFLPFILKARRRARFRDEQAAQAAAAEMGMAPHTSSAGTLPRDAGLSRDYSAPGTGSLDSQSQPVKDYETNGTSYANGTDYAVENGHPIPTQSPHYAAAPVSPLSIHSPISPGQQPGSTPIPWSETPEGRADLRRSTLGSMGGDHTLSRSATASSNTPHSPAIARAMHHLAMAFRRGSTRSSGSDSHRTPVRSPTMDMDELAPASTAPPAFPMIDEAPPGTGEAASYYSGAPMSPPEEGTSPAAATYPGHGHGVMLMSLPGPAMAGAYMPMAHPHQSQSPEQLGSPFAPPPAPAPAPLTPASAIKEEDSSDEDRSSEERSQGVRSRFTSPAMARLRAPPSPLHPAPGTVNPMDIMRPSNATEQDVWVNAELERMENSPPPPQVPEFAAVVRQPTEINLGGEQSSGPREDQMHDISDYSTPPPEGYSSGPSNENTPDTRLTEPDSNYTNTPSPRPFDNPATPNTMPGRRSLVLFFLDYL